MAAGSVDLDRYGCGDFTSDRPLEKLARYQDRVAAKVSLRPRRKVPQRVGGVDVSYISPQRRRGGLRSGGSGHGRVAVVDDHSPLGPLSVHFVVLDVSRTAAVDRTDRRSSRPGPHRAGDPGRWHRHPPSATSGNRQSLGRRHRPADDRRDQETSLRTGRHRRIAALGIAAGGVRRSAHRRGNAAGQRQSPAVIYFAWKRNESGLRGTDCASGACGKTIAIAPLLGGSFESPACENLAIKQNCFRGDENRETGRKFG